MNKEKVTEELVRQNGNQAAAVMADYAGQGGGGGSTGGGSKGVYGSLVDLFDLPCFKPSNEWPEKEEVALSEVLADGYALVSHRFEDSTTVQGSFFIVKVTGSNPSVSVVDGYFVFTDCEPVTLDMPTWVAERFAYIQAIRTLALDDISAATPMVSGIVTLSKEDLPEYGILSSFANAPLLIGIVSSDSIDYRVCVKTSVTEHKAG